MSKHKIGKFTVTLRRDPDTRRWNARVCDADGCDNVMVRVPTTTADEAARAAIIGARGPSALAPRAAKRKSKTFRGLGSVSGLVCGGKIYLAAERLDAGGYTRGGRYFGVGEKLWSFSNDNSAGYVRAPSKAAAKAKLASKCPRDGFAGVGRRKPKKRRM